MKGTPRSGLDNTTISGHSRNYAHCEHFSHGRSTEAGDFLAAGAVPITVVGAPSTISGHCGSPRCRCEVAEISEMLRWVRGHRHSKALTVPYGADNRTERRLKRLLHHCLREMSRTREGEIYSAIIKLDPSAPYFVQSRTLGPDPGDLIQLRWAGQAGRSIGGTPRSPKTDTFTAT